LQITETVLPDRAQGDGGHAQHGSVSATGREEAGRPGSVLAVDSTLGILVQTTDGVLAIRRLKQHARNELDFRSFVNGNPEIIGSVLQQA
jgi:methionyl-tRNA formyltransferase